MRPKVATAWKYAKVEMAPPYTLDWFQSSACNNLENSLAKSADSFIAGLENKIKAIDDEEKRQEQAKLAAIQQAQELADKAAREEAAKKKEADKNKAEVAAKAKATEASKEKSKEAPAKEKPKATAKIEKSKEPQKDPPKK